MYRPLPRNPPRPPGLRGFVSFLTILQHPWRRLPHHGGGGLHELRWIEPQLVAGEDHLDVVASALANLLLRGVGQVNALKRDNEVRLLVPRRRGRGRACILASPPLPTDRQRGLIDDSVRFRR